MHFLQNKLFCKRQYSEIQRPFNQFCSRISDYLIRPCNEPHDKRTRHGRNEEGVLPCVNIDCVECVLRLAWAAAVQVADASVTVTSHGRETRARLLLHLPPSTGSRGMRNLAVFFQRDFWCSDWHHYKSVQYSKRGKRYNHTLNTIIINR